MIRRRAKAINFGVIYGISSFGLSRNLRIPRAEAQEFIDTYFKRFPEIRAYMDRTTKEAKSQGFVRTLFGRRIHTPGISSSGPAAGGARRAAINAPIQGTAADIIRRAMIRMDAALAEAQAAVFSRLWSNRLPLPSREGLESLEREDEEGKGPEGERITGDDKSFHIFPKGGDARYINALHDWAMAASEDGCEEEDGKKKKGGISIPEEWPWEEAKKIFEKPDVVPSDKVEVCSSNAVRLKNWVTEIWSCRQIGRRQM